MSCLVLRLAGPMQSWGTQSRFTERDTGLEPSRSGVIGLLCAALGVSRSDTAKQGENNPLVRFQSLVMGVRVDREGVLSRDYQTAGAGDILGRSYGIRRANGTIDPKAISLSNRYYLADAEFHVALEGEDELLEELEKALQSPRWPLYLGRKAFPPTPPLSVGIREGSVRDVLCSLPWRKRTGRDTPPDGLRLVLECAPGEGAVRMDNPLCFAETERRYSLRYVKTEYCRDFPIQEAKED